MNVTIHVFKTDYKFCFYLFVNDWFEFFNTFLGYGSTAPQTPAGKAAVILYGFFGCSGTTYYDFNDFTVEFWEISFPFL